MGKILSLNDIKNLIKEEVKRQVSEEQNLNEAKKKPSAGLSKKKKSAVVKKAKKGEDIGHEGKGFKEVEKTAKEHGADDPKAVAAAAMWKNIKRK
jgi:hypothetical protein